jgi:hypothetical protein
MAPTLFAGEVPPVSETHAISPVFPPGRYGRRRDGKRRLALPIVFAVAIVVAVVAITFRAYSQWGGTDYDAQIVGWDKVTDSQLTIEFRVTLPAGATAECLLRARDYDGAQVGSRTVSVRANPGETSIQVAEVVPTTSRASVGDVLRCYPAQ